MLFFDASNLSLWENFPSSTICTTDACGGLHHLILIRITRINWQSGDTTHSQSKSPLIYVKSKRNAGRYKFYNAIRQLQRSVASRRRLLLLAAAAAAAAAPETKSRSIQIGQLALPGYIPVAFLDTKAVSVARRASSPSRE